MRKHFCFLGKEAKMFKSLFTIRKKKREKHPQVIVDANRTSFKSMDITHSKKHGKHNNIELKVNPNQDDSRKAYIRRDIVKDFKFNFSKEFKNYKLSDEDIDDLIYFLENKKKK